MLTDHAPEHLSEGELERVDYRAALVASRRETAYRVDSAGDVPKLLRYINWLRMSIDTAARKLSRGEASDGFHTHNELYEDRLLLHAFAAGKWLADGLEVVKSKRHHGGELCYEGAYFIVVAQLPTGQVSFHYPIAEWNLFAVPAQELPPVWDGHTRAESAQRMRDALALSLEEVRGVTKMNRYDLWDTIKESGAAASVPMAALALGTAMIWIIDPTIFTSYDGGWVRFLGFCYVGAYALFTAVGVIAQGRGSNDEQ